MYAATGEVPLAGATEIDAAVRAARRAASGWQVIPVNERRNLLLAFADLPSREAAALTSLNTIDYGTPLAVAQYGPELTAGMFRHNAGWANKVGGDVIPA